MSRNRPLQNNSARGFQHTFVILKFEGALRTASLTALFLFFVNSLLFHNYYDQSDLFRPPDTSSFSANGLLLLGTADRPPLLPETHLCLLDCHTRRGTVGSLLAPSLITEWKLRRLPERLRRHTCLPEPGAAQEGRRRPGKRREGRPTRPLCNQKAREL